MIDTDRSPKVDPENIKFVLSSGFTSFEKGEKFHDMLDSFWGEGIFTTDGETWKTHRANARPFFGQERLSDFAPFETHAQKLLDIMDHMSTNEQTFDLQVTSLPFHVLVRGLTDSQDLFARYTLDTATEFLFGLSMNCLDGVLREDPDAEYEQFMKAFNEVALLSARRIRMSVSCQPSTFVWLIFDHRGSTWPLFEITGDKSVKPTRVIDRFVTPTVTKALQSIKELGQDAKESNFLDYLAHVTNGKCMVYAPLSPPSFLLRRRKSRTGRNPKYPLCRTRHYIITRDLHCLPPDGTPRCP